jgi:DNA mismatch repair protein MSH5
VDDSDGVFQIRPHKDFTPRRGLDRLLSLSLLSKLPVNSAELLDAQERGGSDPATNVYDFMRKRIDINGDPTMKRWNASIRMANFGAFDQSPLCVSF